MKLNFHGKLKELHARTENMGIHLDLKDNPNTVPATNGRRIQMPRPQPHWTDEQWTLWEYQFEHELSHNLPEMRKMVELAQKEKIDMTSFYGSALNLLEDIRIEHHRNDEYVGRKQILERGNKLWWDYKFPDVAPKFGKSTEQERLAMETLLMWDADCRSQFQPSLAGIMDNNRHLLNAQQNQWLDKLLDGNYTKRMLSNLDEKETQELMEDILDNVFQLDSKQEKQKAQQSYKEKEEEKKGKGEEQEGNSKGKGKDKGQDGGAGKDKEKRANAGEVDYSDLLKHLHKEKDNKGPTWTPLKIHYDDRTSGQFDARGLDKHDVVDYSNKSTPGETRYSNLVSALEGGKGLSNKVRKLLQAKSVCNYQHGLKKGKISNKSIFRGTLVDSGEYQRKIFRKKQVNDALDSAVSVLVDGSGSMGGDKMVHAIKSACMLNEAITKLRVPLEIILFDDSYLGPRESIIKSFTNMATTDQVRLRFGHAVHNRAMSGNSDGESILFTYHRLLQQKAKRKVLIVLSDGSPASHAGDADWFTKQVVGEIEKKREVDIYGIGIMDSNVRRIYKHNSVIHRANQLEDALLNVIKKHIID